MTIAFQLAVFGAEKEIRRDISRNNRLCFNYLIGSSSILSLPQGRPCFKGKLLLFYWVTLGVRSGKSI